MLCIRKLYKEKHNPTPATSRPPSSTSSSPQQHISITELKAFIGSVEGYTLADFLQGILVIDECGKLTLERLDHITCLAQLENDDKISGKMKEVFETFLISKTKITLPTNRYWVVGEYLNLAEKAARENDKAKLKELLEDFKNKIDRIHPKSGIGVIFREKHGRAVFAFVEGKGALTKKKYEFVQNLCVEIEAEINKLP